MSSGFLKRLLLALLGILLVAIAAFAVLLHNAFQATEDGARINSDTLVRMTVNLQGSSPSRAITYTAESEKAKPEAYKKAVLGKIEGDIPMVSLQSDPAVVLHFQDYDYQDIRPELVQSVQGEFRDGTSDDPAWIWDDLAYEQEDSDVKVALDSGKFFQDMDDGDIYGTCVITIAYRYQGNDYISVTAVQVGR